MVEFFLFEFIRLRVMIESATVERVTVVAPEPRPFVVTDFVLFLSEEGQYVDGLIQASATCLIKS